MLSVEEVNEVKGKLMFWLKRWHDNPLAYVIECLGEIPTHQQACILKAFARYGFVSVATGHGIGKTRLEGWLTHWYLDTHGKRVPLTAGNRDQLDDVLWPEIVHANDIKWKFFSGQYECLTDELRNKYHKEGWKAVKRTAGSDNVDALQGFHNCMFGIEEASGVYEQVFVVAEGAFGDEGNTAFMFGNPTKTSGYFFRTHNSKNGFWHCMSFSSADTLTDTTYKYSFVDAMGDVIWMSCKGRQTRKWVEKMREEHGLNSNAFRIRVKGEFANIGMDFVIPVGLVDTGGELHDSDKRKPMVMGVDVGYTGDDASAVVIRQGKNIVYAESWNGLDTYETANRVKVIQDEWKCDTIVVDIVGVGAGVYDNLKHMGVSEARGCDVRSKCPDRGLSKTKCKLMRDWLWWQARQYYRTMNPKFSKEINRDVVNDLIRELGEPVYKITSSGAVEIESKDDMKKRGLRSPNLADAHNLTFYGDTSLYTMFSGEKDVVKKSLLKKKSIRSCWKSC